MEVLSANLNTFTLASLLQTAESDQVTGAFRLEPEGSIVLHKGRVVDAVFSRLRGIDAALTLLMVRSERAVFEAFEVPGAAPLIDMMALVIDGARMNDDWGTLAPTVVVLAPGTDVSGLSETSQRVLAELDGQRVVNEAIDRVGAEIVVVIDDLLDLREAGKLVEVAPPRPEKMRTKTATPAPAPRVDASADHSEATFYQLIDDSRAALREKAYLRALELLERAAEMRPDDRTVFQNIRRIRQLVSKNA